MFSIVGNLNFIFEVKEFQTLFNSLITVLDSSMGNYDFDIFFAIEGNNVVKNFGKVYLMTAVIVFTILILNLIIAILSNTYNRFNPKSNGLYLSKILSMREEFSFDPYYGAFLSAMSPINVITIPLVPVGMFIKPHQKLTI